MTIRAGLICGLKSEARAVTRALNASGLDADTFLIGISGADASRAEDIAESFVARGAPALFSIGVSGGLDPARMPGDLVLAHTVAAMDLSQDLSADGRAHHDGGATREITSAISQNAFPPAHHAQLIFGSDAIIQSREEKSMLFRRTGAVAVDMESHGVAHTAMVHDLPFLAVRAIADPAGRTLPPAALGAVAPDGSTRIGKTLLAMTKAPGEIPALLQLGSDSQAALASLRRDLGGLLRGFLLGLNL